MKILPLNYNFFYGAVIGLFSWGWQHLGLTVLSLAVFLQYFYSKKRSYFFVFVFGYYLAATRGMLFGANVYFDGMAYGFAVWIADALIVSGAYILFWSKSRKVIGFILTIILLVIPPVGFIEWVNPIFTAGIFFPGTGFVGLIFLFICVIFVGKCVSHVAGMSVLIGIMLFLIIFINNNGDIYKAIEPINTNFGQLYKDETDFIESYKTQNKFLKLVKNTNQSIVVLPETALGWWNNNNMLIWSNLPDDKIVIAGANMLSNTIKDKSENVILKVTNKGYNVIYRQRLPIPISMWKPWSTVGAAAHYFDKDSAETFSINDIKAVAFLCYEQLLPILYIESLQKKPDVMIGISNLWWNIESSGENIQRAKMNLMSRLYNVPFIFAANRRVIN
ncbi:MAG: hypothetical protein LBD61_02430 [Endomicrobium sp.]|nr:hypothetical protein [Endomicrobium sp.]